jgi:hypothetical protein
MTMRRAALVSIVVWAGACSDGPTAQKCHLIEEVGLYRSGARRLHAIGLARQGRRLLAAWSDEDGVRTAIVGERGEILEGPTRIRTAKATSLDAVASGDGFLLGILEPSDLLFPGGGAFVARLDRQGRVQAVHRIGPAGAYSKRIAVTPSGAVAWHDGGPGVFVVRAHARGRTREIAKGRMGALAPAIADLPERALALSWVELESGWDGSVAARVRFGRFGPGLEERGAAEDLARTTIQDADPAIVVRRGKPAVFFRDLRDGERRVGYYLTHPGARTPPARIGRANGPSGPDVTWCHGTWAGATVRTHGQELLLGFNRFDDSATKKSGELQIYSDRVHFAAVEIECLAKGWVLLYAEEHPQGARLLFNTITCDAES